MGWHNREQIAKSNKDYNTKRRRQGERINSAGNGYVFVIVLWVIVVLSFVAIGSLRSTRVAVNLEKIFEERAKNLYAAKNACLFALTKTLIDSPQSVTGTATVSNIDIDTKKDEDEDSEKPWGPKPEPYLITINDMDCDIHIEDEGGKINLNTITDDNKDIMIDFLVSNKAEKKDAETITDSLLDWMDKDDLHHINGAETPYYEGLPEPYKAKNAQFDSTEELLLIKGITPNIFENIREEVTVFGSDKININFAVKDVIISIPGIDEDIADELLKYIEENGPVENEEELRTIFFSFGIAGASFEDTRKYITLVTQNYVTIRSACSSASNLNSTGRKHQYRIIAEIIGDNQRILAAYAD